ncbi:unnamed protein product [Rhizophagus irregularis]|nr:unnamed protein product [Rhizophagus irregularis]
MQPQIRRNELSGTMSLITFNTAKRYREGGVKKSLVWERIYEEFSTLFWLKPELSFDQQHNESVRRKSGTSSSSEPSTITTPEATAETPTLPSFSQNANVIDVTINNNYAGAPEEED